MGEIRFTGSKQPYGWMGNMSPYPVMWEGKMWKTTEALFQAMRFPPETPFPELIRNESFPMSAKLKAKANEKWMNVEQLSKSDLNNMYTCIKLKVTQHPNLLIELLNTGNKEIYEDVTKRGDKGSNLFWGAIKKPSGEWVGDNKLGVLWMKLREELKNQLNRG